MPLVSAAHATPGEQMGRAADVPGSSQTAHKEQQQNTLKEVKACCMAITSSSLWSSWSGYATGQRSRQAAHVVVRFNAAAAQSYWLAATPTCLLAQLLVWGDRFTSQQLHCHWARQRWQGDSQASHAPQSSTNTSAKRKKGEHLWKWPHKPHMAPGQCFSSDKEIQALGGAAAKAAC